VLQVRKYCRHKCDLPQQQTLDPQPAACDHDGHTRQSRGPAAGCNDVDLTDSCDSGAPTSSRARATLTMHILGLRDAAALLTPCLSKDCPPTPGPHVLWGARRPHPSDGGPTEPIPTSAAPDKFHNLSPCHAVAGVADTCAGRKMTVWLLQSSTPRLHLPTNSSTECCEHHIECVWSESCFCLSWSSGRALVKQRILVCYPSAGGGAAAARQDAGTTCFHSAAAHCGQQPQPCAAQDRGERSWPGSSGAALLPIVSC